MDFLFEWNPGNVTACEDMVIRFSGSAGRTVLGVCLVAAVDDEATWKDLMNELCGEME